MKKKFILLAFAVILGGLGYAVLFSDENFLAVRLRSSPQKNEAEKSNAQKNTEQPSPTAKNTKSGEITISDVPAQNTTGMPLELPGGFRISIFAKNLVNPRVMHFAPDGRMLVSVPSQGKIIALSDKDTDGIAEKKEIVLSGLNRPHGIESLSREEKPDALYIAESDQISRYDYDSATGKTINKKKILDLPGGGNHFTRTLMFMPYPDENRLLVSVGSSCNVCNEKDSRRAKILRVNWDGYGNEEYATGLRNSVFMAIHPVTGKIWATEMGRDLLGDSIPPDEINIVEQRKNYGWPICYGKNIHDTQFDKNTYIRNPCMDPFETPSYIDIPAHSAPLGLAFFPEEGWPKEYWHNLLVAYHGSWNRTVPTGYKIVRYILDENGKYLGEKDFISGWLKSGRVYGRPVDIKILPGGIIFITDDKAGVIYRVSLIQ